MKKVEITVVQTRVLQREFEVSDQAYDFLNSISQSLNDMFNDVVDSKYSSTEYDYAVKDCETGEMMIDFTKAKMVAS